MTESFEALLGALLFWAGQALLYGTVLAGLTALLCSLMLRRARPALHAFLWTVVLLRFLLPPVLPSVPYVSDAARWISSEAVSLLPGEAREYVPEGTLAHSGSPAATEPGKKAGLPGWAWFAVAAYLLGLAVVAGRSLRLNLRNHRWVAGLPPAGPDLEAVVRRLAARIGLRRVPAVRVTDRVTSPLVLGLVRPQLVLSQPLWESLSPQAARALVVHELAHIRRGDLIVRCLETLARLFLYFWPPVHWASRRVERAAELACDQWAVRTTGVDPREYARSLLVVVRSIRRESGFAAHLAFANRRTSMEERFEMILKNTPHFSAKLTWTMFPMLALWCAFALAGYSPEAPPQHSNDQPAKLVVHIKGDVHHLSIPADALPEADLDQDGHLSLEELQNFQSQNPDRLDLAVEPDGSGMQEVNVRVTGHVKGDGSVWVTAGSDDGPITPIHAALSEVDRQAILDQNPQADADGDGRLSEDELKTFLHNGPVRIQIHAESDEPAGEHLRKIIVVTPAGGSESATLEDFTIDTAGLLAKHPELDLNGDGVLQPEELQGQFGHAAVWQDENGGKHHIRIETIKTHVPEVPELNSAERRAQFLRDHPEADLNGDGVISKEEAEALAAKARKQ